MNSAMKDLRIGLVFSGGFAKGAYEIGFCKAIMEYTKMDNIKAVSGASIGAINAYGFINNKFEYLCKVWKSLEFRSAKEFFVKSDKRKVIYDYITDMQLDEIKKSEAACYINYIKVPNITLCYKNVNNESSEIQNDFLKASISVPGLYNPILVKEDYYVDGAFLDNTPISPLANENLDLIFVLRFDHASEEYHDLNTNAAIIEIVFEDDKKLKDYFYFNSSLTNRLIEQGYKKSKDILEVVFKYGENIEYIKSIAKIYNQESRKNLIPKSGEELVNKMNKLKKIFRNEYLDDENEKNDTIYDSVRMG
ncbi:MAG TPA: patatin-like phospholipase family protein [Clostridiaceae bacterium]|nr:patatin-like phospholipase family protein [Clostridiaceae bacterium]